MIFRAYLVDKNLDMFQLPHSDISIKKYRKLKASELVITVVETAFSPEIGDSLLIYCDESIIFKGKVFEIHQNYRTTTLVAYDDLIYLLQNETVNYYGKTASWVLEQACNNVGLTSRSIGNTLHSISSISYENTSYIEIIDDLLTQTSDISNKPYVLYDNYGTMTLCEYGKDYFDVEMMDCMSFVKYCNFSNCNYIKIEQKTQGGSYKYYEAYDSQSINQIGKFQKIIRVDRDLTSVQCNELAKNYLAKYSVDEEVFEITTPFVENMDITSLIYFENNIYYIDKLEISISGTQSIVSLELWR